MPSPALRDKLHNLAHAFADAVFDAIRSASLHELSSAADSARGQSTGRRQYRPVSWSTRPEARAKQSTRAKSSANTPSTDGPVARRSPDQLEAVLGRVVAALAIGPMSAEEIKKTLGLDRKELPRVLAYGLKTRALTKKGRRRATVYSAG